MCIFLRMKINRKDKESMSINFLQSDMQHSVALVRKRTIPTERPPFVGDVKANFCG
jgi:hypothetical protein